MQDEPGGRGPAWHEQSADGVLAALKSGPEGLSPAEAAARLARHGPNALPPPRRTPWPLRLLAQFHNALIYFLLAAGVAALALEHAIDAAVIFGVVVINAFIGFIQEGKAEQALAAIQTMIAPGASVLRGGQRMSVPAAELVPGDIVMLEAGDRVPADLRLLHTRGLLIDEAILTGESVAAAKSAAATGKAASLGDRRCMAYSGTIVMAGQGRGVVTATGSRTEIGRISALLGEVPSLTTPLLRRINAFGRGFTAFAVVLSALLLAFAVGVRGQPWGEAMLTVVALAVALIPEGLPAVITITLAIGVQRMAARRAIVRRLPAVETLGATSVICSDKTGTLTRNEMAVRRLVSAGRTHEVEGTGYGPEGRILGLPAEGPATELIRAAVLCNDAHVAAGPAGWQVAGDPMEGALVTLGLKAGLAAGDLRAAWPRLDAIPFDARHRYMATLHAVPGGGRAIFVKGAPERLLAMCREEAGPDGTPRPLDPGPWHAAIEAAAAEGMRVLGFAARRAEGLAALDAAAVEDGLVFLGIAGLIDPPRPEAVQAVAECRAAGIEVKMITGDHAVTAVAIARALGLAEAPAALTGADLDRLDEAALRAVVRSTAVFARTSPEHKLRIVRALQAEGAVVAMTGDGVNDAPALKQADIGIAMGRKGTEAAKQAAEMVLADDNFATIAAAVHEGRVVFDNIRKVIAWTLPTNGGEVTIILIALLLGLTIPISPVQVLWVNMITSVTLGLVLAFEPAEDGVMRRPPRPADAPLLPPFLVWRVVFVSAAFVAAIWAVFEFSQRRGDALETSRTLVVNLLVALEIAYLFNVRFLHQGSITLRGAMGTPVVLVGLAAALAAQAALTYLPPMQAAFQTRPLAFGDLAMIAAVAALLLVVFEAEKWLARRSGLMDRLDGGAPRRPAARREGTA
ncbi:MAG: HAD-IC family P-type ATPase [Rhodobacteraceae bacterium]|nr:HAD-IC family P-type ATPase [Paracoccaceae bacterium]